MVSRGANIFSNYHQFKLEFIQPRSSQVLAHENCPGNVPNTETHGPSSHLLSQNIQNRAKTIWLFQIKSQTLYLKNFSISLQTVLIILKQILNENNVTIRNTISQKEKVSVISRWVWPRDLMDCSLLGSVHGILQTRTMEWVAIPFSRRPSRPKDPNQVSCIARRFFNI